MDDETAADRVFAAATAGEREVLAAFLDFYRDAVVGKLADLDEEQARRRLVGSATTPAGLLAHLRVVEMNWFQRTLGGVDVDELPVRVDPDDPQSSFTVGPAVSLADLVAAYREQCALSRRLLAARELGDVVDHHGMGRVSVRWILVHMIDETARHAGHADILRELIDGHVGAW